VLSCNSLSSVEVPKQASTKVTGGNSSHLCECGLRERLQSRIVGGERSNIQEYPWIAAITAFGTIFCGGALIDDRHILTAAHCFKQTQLIPHVGVRLGVTSREETGDLYEIDEIIINKKYNKSHSGFFDIALIRLKKRVQISNLIQPICLPAKMEDYAGQFGIVAGWGVLQHKGAMSSTLQSLSVQIYGLNACKTTFAKYKKRVDENNICAGGKKGKDACQGDSGSPLFLEVDGRYRVIGLVSWGLSCALDKIPGVYTNVAYYLPWIREQVKNSTCF